MHAGGRCGMRNEPKQILATYEEIHSTREGEQSTLISPKLACPAQFFLPCKFTEAAWGVTRHGDSWANLELLASQMC